MKNILTLLLLAVAPLSLAEQSATEIRNHQQYSLALVELLQRSLTSLQACRDEESVRQQLPLLKGYQREMDALARVLEELPIPSAPDYVQAQDQLVDFIRTWRLITEEIRRLQHGGLMSEELAEVLKIRS